MATPVATHNQRELTDFFNRHVQRPWKAGGIDPGSPSFDVKGVKIDLGSCCRGLLESWRLRRAAWNWTRPAPPVWGLDGFCHLMTACRLEYLSEQEFARRLRLACEDIAREYPQLGLWIRSRIALVDFKLCPPRPLPSHLTDLLPALETRRIQAQSLLGDGSEAATEVSLKATQAALIAAAHAVRHVLDASASPTRVSASLMIPMKSSQLKSLDRLSGSAPANIEVASRIWSDLKSDTVLAVVSETPDCGHTGFWVPVNLAPGTKRAIPGAPSAYRKLCGSAVFPDDLPDLSDFGGQVSSRWKAYMEEHFADGLFVSIPILAVGSDGEQHVAGVLNVNAIPSDIKDWARAYHQEWIEVARNLATPFTWAAYYATVFSLVSLGQGGRSLSIEGPGEELRRFLDMKGANGNERSRNPKAIPTISPGQGGEQARATGN